MALVSQLRLSVIALLALWTASALASQPESFVTQAVATIDIDAEGRVEQVLLEGVPGEDATRIFAEQIRQWRFEPVLEDGQAVAARTFAHLSAYAMGDEAGDLHLMLGHPVFRDPPRDKAREAPAADESTLVDYALTHRVVPRYPSTAALNGDEALVTLLVEIDAEGRVVRSGVSWGYLLNSAAKGSPERALQPFARAAKNAVSRWRFAPSTQASRSALVPVRFFMHGTNVEAWQRIFPAYNAREEWVQAALDQPKEDTQAIQDAENLGSRFVLLTPPQPPWM